MQRVIGRIGKAHGIRGEVSVAVLTDDPEDRFAVGTAIRTDPADRGPLTVQAVRPASGKIVVAFDGVADRTAAEALRGTLLVIDTDDLPPIDDEDEFYDHELEGMAVVTAAGVAVGSVLEVVHGPGGDTLVVTPDGSRRELLIPFVRAIVPTIDRPTRTITVDPPEGLLDL